MDKYDKDKKFVSTQYFTKNKEMKVVFLGESKSEKRGAKSLLEAINILLKDLSNHELVAEKLNRPYNWKSSNTGRPAASGSAFVLFISCIAHIRPGLAWC